MKKKKIEAKKLEQVKKTKKEDPIKEKKQPPTRFEHTPFKYWKDNEGKLQLAWDKKAFEKNGVDNASDLLCKTFGTKDILLADNIINRCEQALSPLFANIEDKEKNVVMQTISDIDPQDAVEARLAVQAAVAWEHAMNFMRRGGKADMLCHLESFMNLSIKLMRVHNETIEALSRYKRGGEQRVIVQHVAEKMAVVNNYGCQEGGVSSENKGNTPCSKNAAQNRAQMETSHVANQQFRAKNDADYTADAPQAQEHQMGSSA